MYSNFDNRGFVVPFLLGGLAGGAAVGLSRPRPIYNVTPNTNPGPNMYQPSMPYYSSSYSYYQPMPHTFYY